MLVLWFADCAFRRARVRASGRAFGAIVDLYRYGFWCWMERLVTRYCGGVSHWRVMLRKDEKGMESVGDHHSLVCAWCTVYIPVYKPTPSVQYVLYNVPQFLIMSIAANRISYPNKQQPQTPAERTISDSQDNHIASRFISLRGGQPHPYTPSSHSPSTAS
jgi:hypothetical protein